VRFDPRPPQLTCVRIHARNLVALSRHNGEPLHRDPRILVAFEGQASPLARAARFAAGHSPVVLSWKFRPRPDLRFADRIAV
jgi:hypothetical protein